VASNSPRCAAAVFVRHLAAGVLHGEAMPQSATSDAHRIASHREIESCRSRWSPARSDSPLTTGIT
jgi:hypothetical protein